MNTTTESGELKRRIERLSAERVTLFAQPNASAGDKARLKTLERELDECYLEQRRLRAVKDARRFVSEYSIVRVPRPDTSSTATRD